jgi:HTH-type transcriptional regulator/antitoxin HigA
MAIKGASSRKRRPTNKNITHVMDKPAKSMRTISVPIPRQSRVSRSYLILAAAYPIHPIRSDEDLDEAIAVLDRLQSRRKPLDSQEQEYLESLSHEIERYEEKAVPMPAVSEAAMLRHLMEAREVNLTEVAEGSGVVISTLSAILNGKRRMNKDHMMSLAAWFHVPPSVFLP